VSKNDKIASDIKMLKARNLKRFTGESFERWEEELAAKALKTRSIYLRGLEMFLEWSEWDTEELIKTHSDDIRASYPVGKTPKRVSTKIKAFMRHLVDEKGKSGSHAKSAQSAITSLLSANGYEGFRMSRKNGTVSTKSRGGSRIVTPKQLKLVLSLHNDLMKRAFLLVGKDSGLRLGDVISLNYGDIKRGLGTKFYYLDQVTEKSSSYAQPILGFEALDAIELWINLRRSRGEELRDETPLFIPYRTDRVKAKTDAAGNIVEKSQTRWDTTAASIVASRMFAKAGIPKCTYHSLRKMHTTYLELGGLSEPFIATLQGRTLQDSRGPYKQYSEEILISEYSKAYPSIQVTTSESKQVKEIQGELETLRGQMRELQEGYRSQQTQLTGALAMISTLTPEQQEEMVKKLKEATVK